MKLPVLVDGVKWMVHPSQCCYREWIDGRRRRLARTLREMRTTLLMLVFMAGVMSAKAQTVTDLNEGLQVTVGAQAGEYTVSWWGKAGRTYFIQQSFDLMTWTYVPVIESGAEAVCGLNVSCSETRQFWRLRYTDQTYTGTAAEADFDGDGVSNQEELDQGLDPFSPDSDGDGVGDADEIDFSLNKTGNDMTQNAAGLHYNAVNRLEQRTESGVTQAVGYDNEGNITEVE